MHFIVDQVLGRSAAERIQGRSYRKPVRKFGLRTMVIAAAEGKNAEDRPKSELKEQSVNTNFTKVNLMKFNRIATFLAVGIAASIGTPALAGIILSNIRTGVSDLVVGGTDHRVTKLYLCRVIHDGEPTPGKYYLPNRTCYVPWGGREYPYRTDFVVGLKNWDWPEFTGNLPTNAPAGGTENNGKNKLYFCTAIHRGEYTPGKYYPPNKTCYIAWGGREYQYKTFRILVGG